MATSSFTRNHRLFNRDTIETLFEALDIEVLDHKEVCTKCNKNKKVVIKYSRNECPRYLCRACAVGGLDRLFGMHFDPKVEEVLFGDNE